MGLSRYFFELLLFLVFTFLDLANDVFIPIVQHRMLVQFFLILPQKASLELLKELGGVVFLNIW